MLNKKNKRKTKDTRQQNIIEDLKMEIAEELGLAPKIRKYGWSSLSSAESGRIGGILAHRLKNIKTSNSKPTSCEQPCAINHKEKTK